MSASIASRANPMALSFSGFGNSVGDLTVNEGLGSPLVVRKFWMKVVFFEMRSETSTKLETSKAISKALIQAHKNRGRNTHAVYKTRLWCSHQLICAYISSFLAVRSIRELVCGHSMLRRNRLQMMHKAGSYAVAFFHLSNRSRASLRGLRNLTGLLISSCEQ